MKKAVAILLALVLLLGSAAAETMVCVAPEGQYVNVRQNAKKSASTWGELRNGDTIEAGVVDSGWVQFVYDGHEAYAMVKFFEIEEDSDFVITANGRVAYRNAPSGDFIDWYDVGSIVHIDGWTYDKDNAMWGRSGARYVKYEFLEPVGGQ